MKLILPGIVASISWFLLSSPSSAADIYSAYNAAVSGDMATALKILDSLDVSTLRKGTQKNVNCMRQRFSNPPEIADLLPLSQRILTSYRHYWQTAMLRRATAEEAETELLDSLNAILPDKFDNLDSAGEHAKDAIKAEGLFALTGVTTPYYELMLWRTQVPKTYHVKLPEKEIGVHVVFLDDFVSLGWVGYATCGRSHTGGWATQDSLFAVQSAYDTLSESFHVSYLAHEGRHFSDYREFPNLEQPELEYRAKLTEIALADSTLYDLITGFSQQTGNDRSNPHFLADYWVAHDIGDIVFNLPELVSDSAKWHSIPKEQLRQAALEVLTANSERLQQAGAESVEQFLGDW